MIEWPESPTDGTVSSIWLGQAGFLLRSGNAAVVIDPYLSDYLAAKYRGAEFPHTRMARPPIKPEELTGVDAVLCTHAHSDHMDPETLRPLASVNPGCTFVVPAFSRAEAVGRGAPEERTRGIDAGNTTVVTVGTGNEVTVRALPAAHESLETNGAGEHRYLGYIVDFGGVRIYHSGDCIPYEGIEDWIGTGTAHAALLPVNGRDEYRKSRGVPGNFTVEEAVELCERVRIPLLVPHHFGMFDFNTVDPADILRIYRRKPRAARITVPVPGKDYRIPENLTHTNRDSV